MTFHEPITQKPYNIYVPNCVPHIILRYSIFLPSFVKIRRGAHFFVLIWHGITQLESITTTGCTKPSLCNQISYYYSFLFGLIALFAGFFGDFLTVADLGGAWGGKAPQKIFLSFIK